MPKKIDEKLHILCPYRGYIAAAKIMGPIVQPLQVYKSAVVQILLSGAEVHEYDPKTKETIKLTLTNINNPNRFGDAKKVPVVATPVEPVEKTGVHVTPVIEELPVAQVSQTPEVETETEAETKVESDNTAVVTEEPVVEESTTVQAQEDLVVFEYNEDGTVNETVIDWAKYTKSQRKAIRAQINTHNASLTN